MQVLQPTAELLGSQLRHSGRSRSGSHHPVVSKLFILRKAAQWFASCIAARNNTLYILDMATFPTLDSSQRPCSACDATRDSANSFCFNWYILYIQPTQIQNTNMVFRAHPQFSWGWASVPNKTISIWANEKNTFHSWNTCCGVDEELSWGWKMRARGRWSSRHPSVPAVFNRPVKSFSSFPRTHWFLNQQVISSAINNSDATTGWGGLIKKRKDKLKKNLKKKSRWVAKEV